MGMKLNLYVSLSYVVVGGFDFFFFLAACFSFVCFVFFSPCENNERLFKKRKGVQNSSTLNIKCQG